MSKKPKNPEKTKQNRSNLPPDFTPLLNQATEIQDLIRNKADQKTIDAIISGLEPPNNLSLMQLSAIPKLINSIQTAWAAIVEKDTYTSTGQAEMLVHIDKMISWLNLYSTK